MQQNAFATLTALPVDQLPPGNEPAPKETSTGALTETIDIKLPRLILRREKKDRSGKTVVIVSGFNGTPGFPEEKIETVARALRQKLGCGGAVEGTEIVLQGDQPARVTSALSAMGFRVGGVTQ